MTEKAWEGAGQEVGVQIWRIVKFKVNRCMIVGFQVNLFDIRLNIGQRRSTGRSTVETLTLFSIHTKRKR